MLATHRASLAPRPGQSHSHHLLPPRAEVAHHPAPTFPPFVCQARYLCFQFAEVARHPLIPVLACAHINNIFFSERERETNTASERWLTHLAEGRVKVGVWQPRLPSQCVHLVLFLRPCHRLACCAAQVCLSLVGLWFMRTH